MNILMVTNVFAPQIGGVTRSIEQFSAEFRERGHRVLVVAPDYHQSGPTAETDVIRVPAIPNFYQDQYPLPMPVMTTLLPKIRKFAPDIVHTHHPFLLGTSAQTIAAEFETPLVYTHHTRYSVYIDTKTNWPHSFEEAIVELISGYCELADITISPSDGIRKLLRDRGIKSRIEVVSTGVDVAKFAMGNGRKFRERYGIPPESLIVGHCGRLSKEKNCHFLAASVAAFLKESPECYAVVVGDGPERATFENVFSESGTSDQVIMTGFLEGSDLVDAYHAMDVFAFASHSETQGMVLGEAMAARTPVIALSATGVDDIMKTGVNGYLVPIEDQQEFVAALRSFRDLKDDDRQKLIHGALQTAEAISQKRCADKMLAIYEELVASMAYRRDSNWHHLLNTWDAAWNRWKNRSRFVATLAKEAVRTDTHDSDHPSKEL